ncbi:D-2-hydroxyacid dehydrogenase [Ornithinibacillus gellani]|uniref:D-2-hydroxyacid dehydrogenase n=1 Tax=Ornithinibacillus gellani TaxID=2293253 RepID=UPI000F46677C|nr:D-2-hydroxyacid dehydrogenase [Ornithinibacillus gellani]TQS70650.1 D-2-hydroxyacid dehydrogenase [Ornithinibacillus gellani]
MTILFSAKLSEQHQQMLTKRFPKETFLFYHNMDEAKQDLERTKVLVTYGEDFDEELLAKAKKLEWIMVISAGLDKLPLQKIAERDILLTNVRGIHKIPMAEYVISMLLQVYRNEKALIENEKEHVWERRGLPQEISEQTMLVAGTGAIGQEVARLAKAFRMKTIGVSRSGRTVTHFDENYPVADLKKVLPEADFVVSVLPSTDETRHLFTMEHFRSMKDHTVFVNIGRGDLVESEVLIQAIKEQEIAHAILDVAEEEPLPHDHPLWEVENITITPHASGVSPKYLDRSLAIFMENLEAYVNGSKQYKNVIETKRGY